MNFKQDEFSQNKKNNNTKSTKLLILLKSQIMKTIILTAIFLASMLTVNAKVWRLNNRPGTHANFSTLQQAHDAVFQSSPVVQPGDTLYLEASSGSYGNLIATKKLTIIGAGFFITQNIETQADYNTSSVSTITFNNGSQGSSISGCSINNIVINTSDILIERNNIQIGTYNSHCIIFSSNNVNNVIIRNNYIKQFYEYGSGYCITSNKDGVNNVIIKNNYLQVSSIHENNLPLNLSSGFSGIIENNVIYGNIIVYNCTFNNNILRDGSFSKTNTTWSNNIGNGNQFGDQYGNQQNINMLNVFTLSGSSDGKWQLKPGSPAIGAGVGGIDCGMFGGERPYVLSGIPAIPAIYHLQMELDNLNNQIEVEMSVKSRN